MKKVLAAFLATVALLSLGSSIRAEESPVKSRIVAINLFKNGLAVVKQEATLDGPGTYRLDDVPEPVHGTYWIESTGSIESLVRMREVEVPAKHSAAINLQRELSGKKVILFFRNEKIPQVQGTVAEMERPKGEEAAQSQFLVVQTARGRVYVDASQIAYVEAEGMDGKVKQRKPVLILTVAKDAEKKPVKALITYLSHGITWAPSYRVDISDPKTLTIEQNAVIKNELSELKDTAISLISGYPSVQFGHVVSPLSARTTLAQFFQELEQRPEGGRRGGIISQQSIRSNAFDTTMIRSMGATPTGEGVDLHYQSIGRRSLEEGDSLALSVASGKTAYDRIVDWVVPDTRDEYGHHRGRDEGEDSGDAAWDALRFKNPLGFPMTTAPAMVVANGKFNGQRMSSWVNAGEETVLRVNKALSIRTRATEHEEQGKNGADTREIVYIGGRRFQKSLVQGELTVSNHRNETISLVIRRRFSGDLLSADASPKLTLREEGVYSVNRRNELSWSQSLKPGEEKKLGYRYSVLVSY